LCAVQLAGAYGFAGQLDISRRLLEPVLEKQLTTYGATHPATLDTMQQLGWTYGLMERYEDSLTLLEKCVSLRKTAFGPGDRLPYDLGCFAVVSALSS